MAKEKSTRERLAEAALEGSKLAKLKMQELPAESQPQWNAENAHQFPGAHLTPIFANRFYFLLHNGMARLSFGESLFGEPMKTSVVVTMSMGDAKAFMQSLSEVINQVEQQTTQENPPNAETSNN